MENPELIYFKLAGCPYCRQADKWIAELVKEHPEFAAIRIREIDEDKHPEIAEKYDYYYVPTLFLGGKKLHEGAATKEKLLKAFTEAISDEALTKEGAR